MRKNIVQILSFFTSLPYIHIIIIIIIIIIIRHADSTNSLLSLPLYLSLSLSLHSSLLVIALGKLSVRYPVSVQIWWM